MTLISITPEEWKAMADRIAQLEASILELRDALRRCAHPDDGWPEVYCADAYEHSRTLVPDAEGEHPELRAAPEGGEP